MNGEQSPDCLRRSLQERKRHSFVTPVDCSDTCHWLIFKNISRFGSPKRTFCALMTDSYVMLTTGEKDEQNSKLSTFCLPSRPNPSFPLFRVIFSPSLSSAHLFYVVDYVWNVMAHAQKPDFVFRRNGQVHLNRRGASVQSTTGSRRVRISGSNAWYTMFPGSVKSTGYPFHSSVSPSLPLPCVTMCHHVSTGL